jgi:hypothetical protein
VVTTNGIETFKLAWAEPSLARSCAAASVKTRMFYARRKLAELVKDV